MMHGMVVDDSSQRGEQVRKGFGQAEPQRAIIRGGQFAGHRHQRLAECVASRKAPDARHRITRKHRCAIVKPQPLAQPHCPEGSVVLDSVPFDHLGLSGQMSRPGHKVYRTPNSAWLCVARFALQTGSSEVRSGVGTNLSVRSRCARAICGAASIAAPADSLSMSRRRMVFPYLTGIHERLFGAEGLHGGPFLLAAQENFTAACRARIGRHAAPYVGFRRVIAGRSSRTPRPLVIRPLVASVPDAHLTCAAAPALPAEPRPSPVSPPVALI